MLTSLRSLLAASVALACLPALALPVARIRVAPPAITLAQYVTTDGSPAASFGYLTPNGGWGQFVAATCGTGCANPQAEMTAAQQNWTALQAMGALQWLGSTYNGVTIDPSALLSASRAAGATQVDAWVTTGTTGDPATDAIIAAAILADNGYDVSLVTGNLNPGVQNQTGNTTAPSPSQSSVALAVIDSLVTGIASGGGGLGLNSSSGSNTALCSATIAATQNAQAQSFVNNMMKVITGSEGISTQSGTAISAGGSSGGGAFGSACLQSLMSGSMDTLFKPPGLSSLISQLGSMFGGGSSSGCGNSPNPLTMVSQSMPTGIFFNNGGFFPALGFLAGEGSSSIFPIAPATGGGNVTGGLSGMYNVSSH